MVEDTEDDVLGPSVVQMAMARSLVSRVGDIDPVAFLMNVEAISEAEARQAVDDGEDAIANLFYVRGLYRTEDDLCTLDDAHEKAKDLCEKYDSLDEADKAMAAKNASRQLGISFEEAESALTDPDYLLELMSAQVRRDCGLLTSAWDYLDEEGD